MVGKSGRAEERNLKLHDFRTFALPLYCCAAAVLLCCSVVSAAVIDRVVAYVDDRAITLSEFQENYKKTKAIVSAVTEEEVINSMINRMLLLKEAGKMKLEGRTEDDVLKDYVDIKIKSSIVIKEDAVALFYKEHYDEFRGKEYLSVRDDIEKYLFELETNKLLKKHIEELRDHSEIKIQLKN
jgi:hypothetical protein